MAADLTSLAQESPKWCLASDVKLLAWLKGFSQDITHRTEALTGRIEALSIDASVAQADLRNAFTSLHQLSNMQFIEQCVQDEDELSAPSSPPPQRTSRPPIAPGPESFEQNVVPKYREAVQVAWQSLKSATTPPKTQPLEASPIKEEGSKSALSSVPQTRKAGSKSDWEGEWLDRPLPLILGTDAFLADEFCGLPPPDTEEYRPPVTEVHEREPREGHFAGPTEDEGPSATEKGGEKTLDSQSEGGEVEDRWTQISSRKEYSEVEPAVSAALNFRAMLEEALRGPSGIYDDVSSPSTRPPIQEDESDSATSASQEAASGASSRKSHGDAKRTGSSNKGSVGSEADLNIEDSGGRTSAKVLSEETNQRLGLQRVGDGPQSRLNSVSQGKAKRVVFSEGADEERPVTLRGDHGEGSREDSAEKAGAGEKDSERSYGAFGNSWDDEEFSFGASTSGKGKPSYTLDLDDLFKRKPRTAPLPNDAVQSDGTLGGGASQAPTDLQPSRNGLGARSQAAAGAGAQPVKNGSGVGLGGKNAAMDAVTAALKQRQAASNAPPEERNSDSVSADWVKTPSGDSLTKPVSVDPESDRVASDETGGWSPSLTNPPLRTELSFGPVEGHADGAEATGREQERSEGGGMFDVRTDDDVAHLRYEDGQEGVASDGFSAGSGQLRELLEAETGLVGSSERGAEEGAGVRTKGAESDEQDPGALQSGSTRKRGDRKIVEKTVQQSGSYGWEKESGGLFGDRNSQAAESRRGETSTSGGQNLGFGKGGTRSRLFGDSDEDDDYGLPLFGGKLGQRQGGRRRGLFEDSDEEPGGSGFGRRSTGLFDNGSALENDDVGAQKRSTGLFGDSGTATGGLFASDRGKGDVSSGSVSEATSLAAKAPLRSVTAKAVGKADEGLLGEPKKQTALSTDLFGDDEEDGDLFGLSGLGRRPRDKPVAEEVGSKRTSGVSALLESTYSSDEEDPWEGRLAKLKEGQH